MTLTMYSSREGVKIAQAVRFLLLPHSITVQAQNASWRTVYLRVNTFHMVMFAGWSSSKAPTPVCRTTTLPGVCLLFPSC